MPEKALPLYRWSVTCGAVTVACVEAAYPVVDDGHMLLKDADHKIVFAAAPGAGCTFTRDWALAEAAVDHWTVDPAPGGRYRMTHGATGKTCEGATEDEAFGRLARELLRDGDIAIGPGRSAQRREDAATVAAGMVSASEIRKMRYRDGDDGDGVRL